MMYTTAAQSKVLSLSYFIATSLHCVFILVTLDGTKQYYTQYYTRETHVRSVVVRAFASREINYTAPPSKSKFFPNLTVELKTFPHGCRVSKIGAFVETLGIQIQLPEFLSDLEV